MSCFGGLKNCICWSKNKKNTQPITDASQFVTSSFRQACFVLFPLLADILIFKIITLSIFYSTSFEVQDALNFRSIVERRKSRLSDSVLLARPEVEDSDPAART